MILSKKHIIFIQVDIYTSWYLYKTIKSYHAHNATAQNHSNYQYYVKTRWLARTRCERYGISKML